MLVSYCSQQRQWNQLGLIIAVTSLELRALLKKLFMCGFITAHMNFLLSTLRSRSCLRSGFPIRRFWDKALKANSSFATCVCVCVCVCVWHMWPLWPHGLQSARLLCPWDSPGKNTGVGCHFLLQGIFLTQGSNSPSSQEDLLLWTTGRKYQKESRI